MKLLIFSYDQNRVDINVISEANKEMLSRGISVLTIPCIMPVESCPIHLVGDIDFQDIYAKFSERKDDRQMD